MKINVSAIRSHYPEALGIRRGLQKLKVKRITRHMLTEKDIELCESDPSKKEAIIYPYLKKWEKYLKPCIAEMQTMVVKSPIFNGGVRLKYNSDRYSVLPIGVWIYSVRVYSI